MILYRFAHPRYALDLSGLGARMLGGRWNPAGIAVTYASEHCSLALLEILVNTSTLDQLRAIHLVQIQVPDTASVHEIKLSGLKNGWYHDLDYTQWMGKEILQNSQSLLIKCPSAVVHNEHNFLINPLHPEFKKLKAARVRDFYFDERLFKPGRATQQQS